MKQLIFILLIVIFFSSCKNSGSSSVASSDDSNAPYMYFSEDKHDFGKVTEGEKISYTFTFENRGKSNLIIKDVETSCGCTVPKYEQKPVAPGKTGTIELVFDTRGRIGTATKSARVISNAKPDEKVLTITCDILTNNSKQEK